VPKAVGQTGNSAAGAMARVASGKQADVSIIALLLRLLSYWKPYKKEVAVIILCLGLQTLFDAIYAVGFKSVIDMLTTGESSKFIWVIVALLAGLLVATAGGMWSELLIARFAAKLLNDIRAKIFDHLQGLSMDFFSRSKAGDVSTRFASDLDPISKLLTDQMFNAVIAVLSLLINTPIMIWFNWQLTLMVFALFPLVILSQKFFASRAAGAAYDLKATEGEFVSDIQETVRIQPAIKLFGLTGYFKARFLDQTRNIAAFATRSEFLTGMMGDTSAAALRIIRLAVIGVGGMLVFRGEMTAGSLVGFISLLVSVNTSISDLTRRFIPGLIKGSAGFRRIDDILNVKPSVTDREDAGTLPRLSRDIRFDGVTFGYQKDQVNLRDVTLTIPANHSVAIVGASGSGKSTLLGLITRFYDPRSGTVSIDDQPIRDVSQASLRGQMGMVFQDSHLVNTTIRENIRLGKLDATDAEIEAAAKAAEIHDTAARMPDGYDTVVGEAGGRLSGGQRQRIAIARAIIKDPSILLLDEASSALDPVTEQAINGTLDRLATSRTMISVTHRLASAKSADLIFVMKDGTLAEQGSHGTLLAARGDYAELWQKQNGFIVDTAAETAEITPERLQAVPIFAGVEGANLAALANIFVPKTLRENEVVFNQGDAGDQFYIVVRGRLEVLVDGDRRISVLEDGDYFGEIALLTDSPRTATIRTISPSMLIALPRAQFAEFIAQQPAVRSVMEAIMLQRRKAL
jgi:ATP-binding cassette, subfamily B, bacterial